MGSDEPVKPPAKQGDHDLPREKRVKLQPDDPETHRPQLIVGIVAYNREATLPRAIESVRGIADRVVVVEGRFEDTPGADTRSSDRTAEIAKRYGSELIQPQTPLPQPQQRDLYIVGKPGDVYLVLDSDEILEGIFPKRAILTGTSASYQVMIEGPRHWSAYPVATIRVYRHIGEKPRHNPGQLLIDGEGRIMDATHPSGFGGILQGCHLRHLK